MPGVYRVCAEDRFMLYVREDIADFIPNSQSRPNVVRLVGLLTTLPPGY